MKRNSQEKKCLKKLPTYFKAGTKIVQIKKTTIYDFFYNYTNTIYFYKNRNWTFSLILSSCCKKIYIKKAKCWTGSPNNALSLFHYISSFVLLLCRVFFSEQKNGLAIVCQHRAGYWKNVRNKSCALQN